MKSVNHVAGDDKTNTDILINILLDRSGSMSGKQSDVIGHYNAFIKEQAALPGKAMVSLVLFDDEYRQVYLNKPIGDVPELDNATYYVRGNTALLDAVGKLIASVDGVKDKPNKVLFLINTDGMENASHEYTKAIVKEMVTERQENHDWQFLFIGAGVDAFSENTGAGLGLKSYQTFTGSSSAAGLSNTNAYSSSYTRSYRTTGATGQSLSDEVMASIDFVDDPDAPKTAGTSIVDKKKKREKVTTPK